MKRVPIFWGTFLVSLGGSMLLYRAQIFSMDWSSVSRYWAVFVIAWGVSLLIREYAFRWIFVALMGMACGFAVASAAETCCLTPGHSYHWNLRWNDSERDNERDNEEAEEEDSSENDTSAVVPRQRVDTTVTGLRDSSSRTDTARRTSPIY